MKSPRIILASRNLRPIKQLGQNFLKEQTVADMIVSRSRIDPDDSVLEIGAGLGALTIPLAHSAKKVIAVEKDRRLIDILKVKLIADGLLNVDLMDKDIMQVDIKNLAGDKDRKIMVVGNLPYNISSQILVKLIESREYISRAVLMFQKELADRLVCLPGCKAYGRITVMLLYCADVKKIAHIGSGLFFPKPKVDSQILEIRFKSVPEHPAKDEKLLFRVIKAGFGNRRKTLKNALAASELHIDGNTAADLLKSSGIDPVRRAETLSVEEFVRLSNNLVDS
jgi:16S rRNA (adenine1518-N6/adenine1519-N6)-dimethyltransferase